MRHQIVSMLVSADWHLGTIPTKRFREELLTLVKDTIAINGRLDLFIVAGDIFDTKEYFSSDVVKAFFYIMIDLLTITKEYGTHFRFLEGTRTHDAMQLDTLQVIFERLIQHPNVKFIQEVSTETIFDMDILYIPEEYVTDSKTYYNDYFNKHYDLLFGHGNTNMMWYMEEAPTTYSSAPVFEVDELCQVANYAYFGHFHYNKGGGPNHRFKSIGPVTRWEFGKTDPCGVYHVAYDTTTHVALETYLENTLAQTLSTTEITINKDYDLSKLQAKIVKKIKLVDHADKIRLIVNIATNLETYVTMRDAILSMFNNYPKVTLMLNPITDKDKPVEQQPKLTEDLINEKPYLYNKSMTDVARIASRIKIKKGINIPIEYITEVITKPNQKGQFE